MGKALDTYQCDKAVKNADALKKAGYGSVGLYYFNKSKFKQQLTRPVALALSRAGLYVFAVWENGSPTSGAYFSAALGASDGKMAAQRAKAAGQPDGTPIYAAYDYDASASDLKRILAYAGAFQKAVSAAGYKAGCYASGLVCRKLKEAGLVEFTWLTQSTGFTGHADWLPHADIVQGPTQTVFGMDIDTDSTNGHAGGWIIQ